MRWPLLLVALLAPVLAREEPSEIDVSGEGVSLTDGGTKMGDYDDTNKPNPPTNIGFCSTDPCTAGDGTDCCCWSNAAVDAHPAYPNPDEVEASRKCETPQDMRDNDLVMLKDPGFAGNSGRLEALKAVAPVYEDRNLCCAFAVDDPAAMSLESPTDNTEPPPETTTWQPEPTMPPPPKSTPDPLVIQDSVATSMEKAAGIYMDAASAIHMTAENLRSALGSVKKEADVNFHKKQFNAKLRGIISHYISESDKAVDVLHGVAAAAH